MKTLQIAFALVLAACAGKCTAQPPIPPDPPKEAERVHTVWSKDGRMPLFLDFGYEWRSRGQHIVWNTGFFHIRPRLDDLIDEDLSPHTFGLMARFERGYLTSPNPSRWFIGASYTFGLDQNLSGGIGSSPFGEAFPFTRTATLGLSGTTVFGYLYSEATQDAGKASGVSTQDALRLEHWDQLGLWLVRLEIGGAVNLNLRESPLFEWEFFFRAVVGRPYLPFGIALGYRYLSTERAGGDFFTLGLDVAF